MKRKNSVLIALASAAVTFGILFATMGKPRYFDRHHFKKECNKEVEIQKNSN